MKKLIAMVILLSSMAIAQVSNPGASFPDPGSAGLCWVSTGATTYAWGSCAGSASTNWSAIVPGTGTIAAGTFNVGTGSSIVPTGSGTIVATSSATATALATPRAIYGNNFDGSAALTQIIGSAFGGTGNGFAKFTGPLTAEKTFTLPNANATILTDGAAVTVAQGGTSLATLTSHALYAGNGTTAPSAIAVPAADSLLYGTTAVDPSFKALPTTGTNGCSGSGDALQWNNSTHVFACLTGIGAGGSGTVNAATQYAFPYYSAAGSATTLSGVAAPTANGFYTVGYNVTGGVALAPTAVLSGVPTNAQVGTTYTVLYSDRNSYLSFSNAGAVTVTLPQAGSTGFTSNFAFVACDIGVGTATIQPTTSTISYSTGTSYSSAQTSMALTTGQCAFIYSDNTNYFAFQIKGGGAGSGTVNSGTAGHAAYYATSTTAVSDSKVTLTIPATGSTLTILDGKTLTANNSITLAGTDSTTMTFPTTSATIARTDAANTFTGHQTIEGVTSTGAIGTGKFVFDTSPTLVTPVLGVASATTLTTTGTTAGFVDYPQGTTSAAVAPCNTATSICVQAPTAVTSYLVNLPGAAANGIPRWANSANVVTESVSEISGDCTTSGSNAITCTKLNGVGVQRVVMTADWTCGTGGVSSSCTAATIVGTGGTPLTITLPSVTASYHWQCDGVVGQATAATANSWNVITATNAPTNLEATYQMNTAATAMTGGAVTGISVTTTTVIAPTWTLGGTATKMPFHIQGSIEGASASGTVISLQLVAPTVADLVTVYRGTSCSVAPF